MGNRITAKVEGGEALIAKLQKMGVDVERLLETAAQAGATVIADEASSLAPSPDVRVETAERERGRVTVDIGPPDEKWHWRFVETGAGRHGITGSPLVFEGSEGTVVTFGVDHPGMAARPFLRPALDKEKDAARDEVGSTLKGALK